MEQVVEQVEGELLEVLETGAPKKVYVGKGMFPVPSEVAPGQTINKHWDVFIDPNVVVHVIKTDDRWILQTAMGSQVAVELPAENFDEVLGLTPVVPTIKLGAGEGPRLEIVPR